MIKICKRHLNLVWFSVYNQRIVKVIVIKQIKLVKWHLKYNQHRYNQKREDFVFYFTD